MDFTLVDSASAMATLLATIRPLAALPSQRPLLYIDLEGEDLSRNGTIAIMQLKVHSIDQVYLVDVEVLGAAAFSTPASNDDNNFTMKTVLESADIWKIFFDVRNDSDALYSLYGINLAGVQDLQLMEVAARDSRWGKIYVRGLRRCIEFDAPITEAERTTWLDTKQKGIELFRPDHDGSFAVFSERPLNQDIINYCVQDVQMLPVLWAHYQSKLNEHWKEEVHRESVNRIRESQAPEYDPKGWGKTLSPWPFNPWDPDDD